MAEKQSSARRPSHFRGATTPLWPYSSVGHIFNGWQPKNGVFEQPGKSDNIRNRAFGKSIILLCIALLAALYSNTSARSGNFAGAVLGAALALVVALWVAWRFVPHLAAAVEWKSLSSTARMRVTREGWVALAATLVVAATAVNTSNNLLYMILSALISVVVLSILLARFNLRSVSVEVRIPPECSVRAGFPMTLIVTNSKRVLPAFSIRVRPDQNSPFRFASSYLAMIGPRDRQAITLETACSKRGHHSFDRVYLESRFPFGFFVKEGPSSVSADCIALPEIHEAVVPAGWTPDAPGSSERFERGEGTDLYLIRDYLATDSARRVDWKASAKTARLKTREFAREDTHRVVLVFDRYGNNDDYEPFEDMVSHAASVASLLAERDLEVALVSDDWTSNSGTPDLTLRSILRYLALVQMTPKAGRAGNPYGGETLVFSLR